MNRRQRIAKRGDLEALQARLGYQFTNLDILTQALDLQKVSASEGRGYDRLEAHGDRLLSSIILELLERHYPDAPLCDIKRMERQLTTNQNLAHLALRLDVMSVLLHRDPEFLFIEKTLADIFEALSAAIAKDAGSGSYLQGIGRLSTVCERLFAIDLQLVQINNPVPMLQNEARKRWGRMLPHEWLPLQFHGQPTGYTCKLTLRKQAAKAFGFSKAQGFVVGTGVTTEQSFRKAAGLALLKLHPQRFSNSLPDLGNFSWRIKAGR